MTLRPRAFFAMALGLLSGACSGCEPSLQSSFGELVAHRAGGPARHARALEIEFGELYLGRSNRTTVVLHNVGRAELEIAATLEAERPSPFSFEPASAVLAGGSMAEAEIVFAPVELDADAAGETFEALIRIETRGENPGAGPLLIRVRGTAVPDPCALPGQLDFGPIERTVTHTLPLELRNPLSRNVDAEFGPILAANQSDHLAFSRIEPSSGRLRLEPRSAGTAKLGFRPMETREYEAKVRVRASEQCDWREVRLTGRGTDEVVVWEPRSIECGFVPEGLTARRTLTISNQRPSSISLSSIRVEPAGEFELVDEDGLPVSVLQFEPRESRALTVRCTPAGPGRREAVLRFDTDVAHQPRGDVPLLAEQGGPDIEVSPSPGLDFGVIGIVNGAASPRTWTRRVRVSNAGTNPRATEPLANLKLGAVGKPYFEIHPANDQTTASEIGVELDSAYDPAVGIAPGLRDARWLRVSITPATVGTKEAELKIYSNDLDEPEVKVHVTAEARRVPSCDYRIRPASVDFGLVTPPDRRTQSFVVENLGTSPEDTCLVSGASIGSGSDSRFAVSGSRGKLLGPREGMEVRVELQADEAAPDSPLTLTGAAHVQIASASAPLARVTLNAILGSSCLLVTPSHLDFGTVRPGCKAVEKQVFVQNVCDFRITLGAIELQGATGAFAIADAPSIPPQGLALEPEAPPQKVDIRYLPSEVGTHAARLVIRAIDGAGNVERTVNVSGTANEQGTTLDRFNQRGREKLDLLILLSHNNSMSGDEAPLIEANFPPFINYLQEAGADFHLAVAYMTSHNQLWPRGTFWIPPEHSEAFLSSETPELVRKAVEKVHLDFDIDFGASNSCFDNALLALTPPLSLGANSGFLRTDARLAVVCISDSAFEESSRLFPDLRPLPAYPPAFFALKSNQSRLFSLSVIAPFDPVLSAPCMNEVGMFGRYQAMVAMTGGLATEICTPDWGETLERVAQDATEYLTRFKLNGIPDTAREIVVRVNGQRVPADDGSGAAIWSFEEDSNEVRFETSSAPEPGAHVEVEYVSRCL